MSETRHYRTIWISDIHLGTRGCKAEPLLDFLRHTESDKLYLVGDIIDGWRLKKNWYWPQSHSTVVQKVLRKSRKGTEVIFIPGNHDEFLRDYIGYGFGDIIVRDHDIHITANGKALLVIHGDIYDAVMNHARWLVYLGDKAYNVALDFNQWVNRVRRLVGLPYWSLSALLKRKVKQAVSIIGDFEKFLVEAAQRAHVDGVVCGHIHHAEIKRVGPILYCNDGDWVESCSALVEHYNGSLEIIFWETSEEANHDLFGYRAGERRLVSPD
ncbi:MAG: UDP-2,3-diacylglucosamine diphosphatase [Rickettsiales bacterium]